MHRLRVCLAMICLAAIAPIETLLAQTPATDFIPYALEDRSDFAFGCFGACDCPVQSFPMKGTLELAYSGFDGLYDNYDVSNVKWKTRPGDREIDIVGSGKYRIGGEVALLQQLRLDLSIDSAEPLHFDSGLVSGAGGFPRIDVFISLHGMAECTDTVMHVVTAPNTAGAFDRLANGLESVQPNPFVDHMQVELGTRARGRVDARIYDALGREVRAIADGTWFPAGRHRLEWDGRTTAGVECAAGVYFVRVRVGSRDDVRRVIKLR